MTASELVQDASNAVFVLIFVAVFARALRRPRRANLDAVVLFGSLAFTVVASFVSRKLGLEGAPLTPILLALFVGLPFFTLRLVDDLIPLPRPIILTALAAWLGSTIAMVALPNDLLFSTFAVVVIYFVAYQTYGGLTVYRAAVRASGIARPRLHAIAFGTLLLGAAILALGLSLVWPPLAVVTNVLGLLCALAYYAGFSTPGPLRRAWQEPELRVFMADALNLAATAELEPVARGLAGSVRRTVGSDTAEIGIWDDAAQVMRLYQPEGPVIESALAEAATAPAFTAQKPIMRTESQEKDRFPKRLRDLGLSYVIAAPVTWGTTRYGVLGVYGARVPPVAEDDMEIVDLLARQIALVFRGHDLFAEVRALNAELERRVAEVKAANDELGSFAYAVSHDLRAPLRAIDGFSEIVLQEKAVVIGDDGREHLGRVRKAAQTMGQLIDDLLQLSRTGRAELHLAPVDLSALGRAVAADHADRDGGRNVRFQAADGLRAAGDERLLRIVLDNLIGNAFKFTRPVKEPRIELGATNGDVARAFYVRDNGVGFDEAYKAKLFVPFQRLHSPREFEGTGIGLATVRRVIHRHGGEVWAESAPGGGATFYFTLPEA